MTVALAFLAAVSPRQVQAAETPVSIRFKLFLKPAPLEGLYIGRIPHVSAASESEPNTLPQDVAAQLSEVLQKGALSRLPDGNRFEALWTVNRPLQLVAKTEPRLDNHHLVEPFFEKLRQCFGSLEESAETDALFLVLYGYLPREPERTYARAAEATKKMVENLNSPDACTTPRNAIPIQGEIEKRFFNATEGLLTEAFDPQYFGVHQTLAIADILHPFFFGSKGLWHQEKEARLKTILRSAFQASALTAEELARLTEPTYTTFFDWVVKTRLIRPGLSNEFIMTIGESCVGSIRGAFIPFNLKSCLEKGKVRLVHVKFGSTTYVLATAGGPR
jgi:hypothetical protein